MTPNWRNGTLIFVWSIGLKSSSNTHTHLYFEWMVPTNSAKQSQKQHRSPFRTPITACQFDDTKLHFGKWFLVRIMHIMLFDQTKRDREQRQWRLPRWANHFYLFCTFRRGMSVALYQSTCQHSSLFRILEMPKKNY